MDTAVHPPRKLPGFGKKKKKAGKIFIKKKDMTL
jgi:hypothetical protein